MKFSAGFTLLKVAISMKKTTKMQIFISILSLLPLVLVLAVYSKLPDKVPMQWSLNGNIRYDDKNNLFIMAIMTIGFAIMFPLLPKIDPKKKNYNKFGSSYQGFQVFIMLFMLFVTAFCIIEAFRPHTLNVPMLACILLGILFAVIGNMMPRFRSNWFCGIRTPWTMSSDENWTKTHRLGGKIFFTAGIIILFYALVPSEYFYSEIITIVLIIACIVPSVYSYLLYKKEENK